MTNPMAIAIVAALLSVGSLAEATTSTNASLADATPFPGSAWLGGYSKPLHVDGTPWGSAYEAVVSGAPQDHPVRNFNAWVNAFVIPEGLAATLVQQLGIDYGHYFMCYLRNLLAGMIIYYGTGAFFHYHCYVHPRSQQIFANRIMPSQDIIIDQMKLSQFSLFFYVMLPVFDEILIEKGFTKVYYVLDDIGGMGWYLGFMVLYFTLVEIGIYWMHRTLHTNKFLYVHVHAMHHKYSKPEMLTPWASIAFHPLDGLLQAFPYVAVMMVVPVHYLTHLVMIFFTAIWATYIHDAMDLNIDPIMGSKYHTVHHTHFVYNYGQIFTFCDRFWGTLRVPKGQTGVKAAPKKME